MLGGSEQVAIRCVIMRGGTSRALFLRAVDLPADPAARDRVILSLFGSPDPRQIDGLGGADILTSKCAIVSPSSRADADLDYTFAQVSISEPVVTYDINCGNISAAVGAYAIQEGIVAPREPSARVRIHNTNTGKVLVATVPVRDGAPLIEGDCVVEGVPGSGAEILLDYSQAAGGATGKLLPTGNVVDRLHIPELERTIELSVVDIGNLCAFVRAADVGLNGTEGPAEMGAERLALVDAIRFRSAEWLGLPTDQLTPIPVVVAPPAAYRRFTDGTEVRADEIDLVARVVGGRPPALHKTFPGTAGVCVAVAAAIPGTIAYEAAHTAPGGEGRRESTRIGHPCGCFELRVRVHRAQSKWVIEEAAYARTARRLMEGYAFLRRAALAVSPSKHPDGRARVARAEAVGAGGASQRSLVDSAGAAHPNRAPGGISQC